MKNLNLKTFYDKIVRNLKVVLGYTEIKDLDLILRACRLKPYDYFYNKLKNKVVLHRAWFDEFGNSLHINQSKNIQIVYGDIKFLNQEINCTDLYYGLTMNKVVKISKLVNIIKGKYEKYDIYYLTFLGIDNYFRTFLVYNGRVMKTSSLIIGFDNIKTLWYSSNIRYFMNSKLKRNNIPSPCLRAESWTSYIPVHRDFHQIIDDEFPELKNVFVSNN